MPLKMNKRSDFSLPKFLVQNEQKSIQGKPKQSQEVPEDAIGFQPNRVATMDDALIDAYRIDEKINQSQSQVGNMDEHENCE